MPDFYVILIQGAPNLIVTSKMSMFYIWHLTNVMLNNAIVSIYGGQIYTVRWQLKNITTLVPGECVNILKSYCKVRYLVECLGRGAIILECYMAFDIFLISLTDDCFINKLTLRDPFKITR